MTVGKTIIASAFAGDGSHVSGVIAASVSADSITGIVSSSIIEDSYIVNYSDDIINGTLTINGNFISTGSIKADSLTVSETITAAAFIGDGFRLTNVNVNAITGLVDLSDSVTGVLPSESISGIISSGNIADSFVKNYESDTIAGNLTVLGSILAGNDSFIVLENGNVGIGTLNPEYKLEVEGTVRIGTGAAFIFPDGSQMNSSEAGSAQALSNNENVMIRSDADHNSDGEIQFNIGTNEKLVILNNGNIGIGTTDPTNKFEVKVPSYFSDTLTVGETVTALAFAGDGSQIIGVALSNITGETVSKGYVDGKFDTVSIDTTALSGRLDNLESFKTTITDTYYTETEVINFINNITADSILSVNASVINGNINLADSVTGNVTISNIADSFIKNYTDDTLSGTLIVTGNIGIGTPNPSGILHTYKSINGEVSVNFKNPNIGASARQLLNVGADQASFIMYAYGSNHSTNPNLIAIYGSNNNEEYRIWNGDAASSPITFWNGNAERVRITNSGNVGIGTTSPVSKLNVVGDIVLGTAGFPDGNNNDLEFSPDGGGTGIQLDYYGGNLGFGNPDGTQWYMRIYDDGKVAIGSEQKGDSLSVFGTLGIYSQSGSGTFVVDNSGNAGIGTTSPSSKLEIESDEAIITLDDSSNSFGSGIHFKDAGSTTWAFKEDSDGTDNDRLDFSNSSGDVKFTLLQNGNVGIGTTSPSDSLHVQGTMRVMSQDNSGTFVINKYGSVGIGTTSPAQKMHIYKDGNVSLQIESSSGYSTIGLKNSQSGEVNFGIYSGYPNAGDFTIRENGVENRLTIKKTSGNVGIGTAAPIAKCDIQGGTVIIRNSVAAGNEIGIQFITEQTSPTTDMSGRIFFRESNAGNYGFSIAYEGHVNLLGLGLAQNDIAFIRHSASTAGENVILLNRDNSNVSFPNGNVGIGTTSPADSFQVSGGAIKLDQDYKIYWGDGNRQVTYDGNYMIFGGPAHVCVLIDDNNNQTDGIFSIKKDANTEPGATEIFRVQENGYVGILDSTPSYTLDVAGTGRFTGNLDANSGLDVTGNITVTGSVDGYDISTYGQYFISSAGSSGQVWTSDGSGAGYWAAVGGGSGAWTLLETVNQTGVLSYDVNFTTAVKAVWIIFDQVGLADGNGYWGVQLKQSGTAVTTGYSWYNRTIDNAGTVTHGSNYTTSKIVLHRSVGGVYNAAGDLLITSLNTGFLPRFKGEIELNNTSTPLWSHVRGVLNSTSSVNGIRFIHESTNNITVKAKVLVLY